MKQNGGKVRLGIIGLGNMGKSHARSIVAGHVPHCELTAVCDIDPSSFRDFPGIPAFQDSGKFMKSGLIDAVLVATPHYIHPRIGIEALKSGLHVLMEKPISVHKADAQKLVSASKKRKLVFSAMFNQRTDPFFQKIRAMVQGGELGKIQRINWIITDWFRTQAYYDSCGWRATWGGEGGGVLLNQCVHNIDLFQWIFGMPSKVRSVCKLGRYHKIEVEDEVTAILEYEDGATGVIITSTGEAPGTNRLEVTGDRGKLVFENNQLIFTRNEVETSLHSLTSKEGYAAPQNWKVQIPVSNHGEQHVGILKNFTNAILNGEKLLAPGSEGIHSVELVNAILYSSFLDKTIKLPLSASAYEKLLAKLVRQSSFKKRVIKYQGGRANYMKH